MNKISRLLLLSALSVFSLALQAELKFENAWVRLLPPGVKTTAAYLEVQSSEVDELLSASTEIADRVEIHETTMSDGMMSMQEIASLAIPKAQVVKLSPGGHHFMVIGLKAPLKEGMQVDMLLRFKNAGEQRVSFQVQAP